MSNTEYFYPTKHSIPYEINVEHISKDMEMFRESEIDIDEFMDRVVKKMLYLLCINDFELKNSEVIGNVSSTRRFTSLPSSSYITIYLYFHKYNFVFTIERYDSGDTPLLIRLFYKENILKFYVVEHLVDYIIELRKNLEKGDIND